MFLNIDPSIREPISPRFTAGGEVTNQFSKMETGTYLQHSGHNCVGNKSDERESEK
jgi:hypothetical protein